MGIFNRSKRAVRPMQNDRLRQVEAELAREAHSRRTLTVELIWARQDRDCYAREANAVTAELQKVRRERDQALAELAKARHAVEADDEAIEPIKGGIDAQLERAAKELPEGYAISIYVENGAGYVEAWDAKGEELPVEIADRTIEQQVTETVDMAIAHARHVAMEKEAE